MWKHRSGKWHWRSLEISLEFDPGCGLTDLEVSAPTLSFTQILGIEIVSAQGLQPVPLFSEESPPEVYSRENSLVAQYKAPGLPIECHGRWTISGKVIDLEVSALTPGQWSGLCIRTRTSLPPGKTTEPAKDDLLVLHRSANCTGTYVEMCHPSDGVGLHIENDKSMGIELFGQDLEKGVILRGRMRAAFLASEDDVSQAGRLYEDLLAQPPPLSG